jgi:hypothetical protein
MKGVARAAPPTAAPIFRNERRLPVGRFIRIFLKWLRGGSVTGHGAAGRSTLATQAPCHCRACAAGAAHRAGGTQAARQILHDLRKTHALSLSDCLIPAQAREAAPAPGEESRDTRKSCAMLDDRRTSMPRARRLTPIVS